MKKIESFIKKYEKKYFNSAKIDKFLTIKLKNLYEITINIKKNNNKILIFGNGGSAAIASHFSVDMTKIGKIRTVNFNESDLLTCFSNDYGYENWVQKALSFYADKGDLLISISSSGESENIINGSKFAKRIGCKVVTLTGFNKNNKVRKIGHVNLWLESKNYNFVEMVHHTWLLSIVDFIAKAKF